MPASSTNLSEPQESYTLNQFIAMKDLDNMTYQRYSILQRSIDNSDILYSIDNVIYTYAEEIKSKRKLVVVTEAERIKYAYKPKLLAYDVYGSTEVFFALLAMNGMHNMKQFDLSELFFFALTPIDLSTFLNDIYNAESSYITLNRSSLGIYES